MRLYAVCYDDGSKYYNKGEVLYMELTKNKCTYLGT